MADAGQKQALGLIGLFRRAQGVRQLADQDADIGGQHHQSGAVLEHFDANFENIEIAEQFVSETFERLCWHARER